MTKQGKIDGMYAYLQRKYDFLEEDIDRMKTPDTKLSCVFELAKLEAKLEMMRWFAELEKEFQNENV